MLQTNAKVLHQVPLAEGIFKLSLECHELAEQIRPGQFFMLKLTEGNDPLLARPFALMDTILDAADKPIGIELGYHVVGKVTSRMATLNVGDAVELWGPLGNGFPELTAKHLVCVGGGIGYTPFFAVCREALGLRNYGTASRNVQANQVTFLYGTRDKDHAAPLTDVEELGVQTMVSSDDGSLGHHGLVTDLLTEVIKSGNPPEIVLCCGPERMMEAIGKICLTHNIPCWLSLESPMACGFGACFSCVAKIKQPDGTWDYRRTCVEGPVFTAEQLVF